MTPRPVNFDPVARPYRLLEHLTLGRALTHARTAFLPDLTATRNALILGDGDGRFLAALLAANPRLHATALDSSRRMLRLLTRRCHFAASRLSPVHADALTFFAIPAATQSIDLVTTHFFLDCFTDTELSTLIPAIRARLTPGALWVISDFHIPQRGPLHLPARALVRALYFAFRLLTGLRPTHLPDHALHLRAAGLHLAATRPSLGGILTAELWCLPSETSATHPR